MQIFQGFESLLTLEHNNLKKIDFKQASTSQQSPPQPNLNLFPTKMSQNRPQTGLSLSATAIGHKTLPTPSSNSTGQSPPPNPIRYLAHIARIDRIHSHASSLPRRPSFRLVDRIETCFRHAGVYVVAVFLGAIGGGFEDAFAGGDVDDVGGWFARWRWR